MVNGHGLHKETLLMQHVDKDEKQSIFDPTLPICDRLASIWNVYSMCPRSNMIGTVVRRVVKMN